MKPKIIFAITMLVLAIAFIALYEAENASNYSWSPIVNNTDIGCYGGMGGTCEKLNGTTYNATSEIDIYIKYNITLNNAHVIFNFYINNTIVLWNDYTTIQADQAHSFIVHVPIGANYSYYNNSVIHHVEIREYSYKYIKVE